MNFLNKAISFVSPQWALNREIAGQQLAIVDSMPDMQASYDGAIRGRGEQSWESVGGWTNPIQYNNGLWMGKAEVMRDRARTLVQNNAIASGMLNMCVNNVVGPNGFGLHVTSADTEWNKKCEDLWRQWEDTADVTGNTWLEHQRLAVYHWQRDGDIGFALLKDGRIQPISGELIQTPMNRIADATCIDGVQVDGTGRPVAFWIAQYDGTLKKTQPIQIPAQDFKFLTRKKNFNQSRGETMFASSFKTFDHLDQIINAVLQAWKIQSFLAFAIIKQNSAQIQGKLMKQPAVANDGVKDKDRPRQQKIESGSVMNLPAGDDIKMLAATQPGLNFSENLRSVVRLLGLENGLPLELVINDFSQTNYASARASILQAYQSFKVSQNLMIKKYLSPIYRWRVSKWMKEGKLPQRDDAWNHRFVPAAFPYLDPTKEIQAAQMAVDAGFQTHAGALLSLGGDFETWITQRAAELKRMEDAGIPMYHSSAVVENTQEINPQDKLNNADIDSAEGDEQ